MKETIIAYLTDHPEAKAAAIAEYIGLKPSRTRDYLNELIAEEIVGTSGDTELFEKRSDINGFRLSGNGFSCL